ncbi:MAG: hypothetical protein EPN48_16020 [Microbacteriaceae bacterium]|nr:MAG: hypothetical protein EPN48_16020 [Microbacteriaceae bacterium]
MPTSVRLPALKVSVDPLLTHTSGPGVGAMTGVLDAGALALGLLPPDAVVVVMLGVVLGAVVAEVGVLAGLEPGVVPASVGVAPVVGVFGSDATVGEDAPSVGVPTGAGVEPLVAVPAGVEVAVVEVAVVEVAGVDAAGVEAAGADVAGVEAAGADVAGVEAAGIGAAVAAGAGAGVAAGSSEASTGHDWPGSSVGAIRPLVVCSRPRK